MKDKYSALWLSYSSISDYLKCPRLYFLKNVHRNPKTWHKIAIISPQLTLGQVIHDVLDKISIYPKDERLKIPLTDIFDGFWQKILGKPGGFKNIQEETEIREKGLLMIGRINGHPGPLLRPAIKLKDSLPKIWLSEEDNIILCGKIDWLEYQPETDSVRIIDFKTGKFEEDPDSLQLQIYYILVEQLQNRIVAQVSFWYLDKDDEPVDGILPDATTALTRINEIAKKIYLARKLEHYKCTKKEGCLFCTPYEKVVRGEAELVGTNDRNVDVYII